MISLIPGSDAESQKSPVGYLEPPPTLVGSPTTPLVEIALPTRNQFLLYTVSLFGGNGPDPGRRCGSVDG